MKSKTLSPFHLILLISLSVFCIQAFIGVVDAWTFHRRIREQLSASSFLGDSLSYPWNEEKARWAFHHLSYLVGHRLELNQVVVETNKKSLKLTYVFPLEIWILFLFEPTVLLSYKIQWSEKTQKMDLVL